MSWDYVNSKIFVCLFLQSFFSKGEKKKKIRITKMIFLTKQINKMTNIALYSDLRENNIYGEGEQGGQMIYFEFSVAIFGPKCGKTHYVALKKHVLFVML